MTWRSGAGGEPPTMCLHGGRELTKGMVKRYGRIPYEESRTLGRGQTLILHTHNSTKP